MQDAYHGSMVNIRYLTGVMNWQHAKSYIIFPENIMIIC